MRNKNSITFSPKLDGVRFLCLIRGKYITLFARGDEPQTFVDKSRSIIRPDSIDKTVVLDIEYVKDLNSIFAFDILIHNGLDVRELSYTERRELLVSKYKNFSREIKIFKFFINESYNIDELDSYDNMVSDVFWKKLRNSILGFDGVVFYDGRYSYPTGSSPTHYGTWKWKPPHELTIDLRISRGEATFPSLDWKSKKPVWNSITEVFPIKNVELPDPSAIINRDNEVSNQSDGESYEFKLKVSNTKGKFDLVPKMYRRKTANKYLNIKSTIDAFKENISLDNIKQFYNFLYKHKEYTIDDVEKFPFKMLKRLGFVSSIVPPPLSKPNGYMVDFNLKKVPDFYGFKDYAIERGKIIDYSELLIRFRDEISQLTDRMSKLDSNVKSGKTEIEK